MPKKRALESSPELPTMDAKAEKKKTLSLTPEQLRQREESRLWAALSLMKTDLVQLDGILSQYRLPEQRTEILLQLQSALRDFRLYGHEAWNKVERMGFTFEPRGSEEEESAFLKRYDQEIEKRECFVRVRSFLECLLLYPDREMPNISIPHLTRFIEAWPLFVAALRSHIEDGLAKLNPKYKKQPIPISTVKIPVADVRAKQGIGGVLIL